MYVRKYKKSIMIIINTHRVLILTYGMESAKVDHNKFYQYLHTESVGIIQEYPLWKEIIWKILIENAKTPNNINYIIRFRFSNKSNKKYELIIHSAFLYNKKTNEVK